MSFVDEHTRLYGKKWGEFTHIYVDYGRVYSTIYFVSATSIQGNYVREARVVARQVVRNENIASVLKPLKALGRLSAGK